MPVQATASLTAVLRDLTIGFRQDVRAVNPIYPSLCTIAQSDGADEKYGWFGGMPGMREWIGERRFNQLRAADYTLQNRDWETSLEFEKNHVEDDRLGLIRQGMADLAREAAYHPDELLCLNIINEAKSHLSFDDQFFFSEDHAWGESGTQSNLMTHTVSDPASVTPAEFRAAYHQALIRMMGFKNDWGKPLMRPVAKKLGNLVIAVPLPLYEVATQAFEQKLLLNGEQNFVIEPPEVLLSQYLGADYTNGSDVRFDLYFTGGPLKPYLFQARRPLRSVQFKGQGDAESRTVKAMTDARYNIGFLAWWTAVRITFEN